MVENPTTEEKGKEKITVTILPPGSAGKSKELDPREEEKVDPRADVVMTPSEPNSLPVSPPRNLLLDCIGSTPLTPEKAGCPYSEDLSEDEVKELAG